VNISPDHNPQTIAIELLEEAASNHQKFKLEVASRSMLPLLQPGNQIIVEPMPSNHLRCGDVVVFRRSSDLVTHRLIAIDEGGRIHTKGDNLLFEDPPVPFVDVLGRVTVIERGQQAFDLTTPRWKVINQVLGIIGGWETTIFQFAHKLIIYLVPKNVRQGASSSSDISDEGLKQSSRAILVRLVKLPFHVLVRTLIKIAQF
jgi:signal peptidase I